MNTRTTMASKARCAILLGACALLSACGGGTQTPPDAPTGVQPAPAPAPPSPPVEGAQAYYFSDCQVGAAAGCVAGSNANEGTSPSSPKQNLTGFNVNALAAGTQLLFARGGAWINVSIRLSNANATPTSPLVLAAYGTGAAPWLQTASGNAVEFGEWNNTTNDGGYTLRNIKFDGMGTANWGLWLRDNLRNLTVENVEITGFTIAIHSQSMAPYGITGVTICNSDISRNRSMGILGKFTDSVIEGNLFEGNNFSGSTFNHAIYLSGNQYGGNNGVIRNNRFVNNSVVDGVCRGGNVTFHGQMTNWLIEGNTIEQAASEGGCYGFSITPGYHTAEWFRGFTVRGNTAVNLGACAICVGAAPGVLVENNKIINDQGTPQRSINIPTGVDLGAPASAGDDVDTGAVVRNNTICYTQPHVNSVGVVVASPGGSVSNNTVHTGAAATTGACAR